MRKEAAEEGVLGGNSLLMTGASKLKSEADVPTNAETVSLATFFSDLSVLATEGL